ncbi:MAG: signal recognition particle-docking protein FtsY [Victivallaceae bacterium]
MKSLFSVFKRGLEKTKTAVVRSINSFFTGEKAWDESTFEELEAMLISADFGVAASLEIVENIRDQYKRGRIGTTADAYKILGDYICDILHKNQRPLDKAPDEKLTVMIFIGVNGSGKTTTIGKLAAKLVNEGNRVTLAAGDTFRAAAVEQLKLWGTRTGSEVIAAKHGADPASVAFDATEAALARGSNYLLIDTAGRQQNKKNLMDELAKIIRSVKKVYPEAPHEVLLTVDASLGSNALNQAREFSKVAPVSGLVLTKLDGTGKGGMVVALHREFNLPTLLVGVGEQPEDLQVFSPEFYTEALLDGHFSAV